MWKKVFQSILTSRNTHIPPPFQRMPIWKQHISKIGFPLKERKYYQCTFCRWSQRQCEKWLIQWRAQWVLHHTHRQPWRGKWIFIKCIIRASFHVFRQIKAFCSPFLCRSGGPPIHQQWEPQCRRNQHLGNILYLVVARLSYPMCQDVCQVLLVRWHISFVVNRPIILPGRPETRI